MNPKVAKAMVRITNNKRIVRKFNIIKNGQPYPPKNVYKPGPASINAPKDNNFHTSSNTTDEILNLQRNLFLKNKRLFDTDFIPDARPKIFFSNKTSKEYLLSVLKKFQSCRVVLKTNDTEFFI